MKYSVIIPKAKTSRMNKENKTLILTMSSGWTTDVVKKVVLKPEVIHCEFEVPDDFNYIHNTTIIDGKIFKVEVEYSNQSESRKEKLQLVPQRISS
jgi:hypothetical protein